MTASTLRLTLTRWLGAFTGFYKPSPSEIRALDVVSRFLYAARSVILVISAQAALIAGLLAATSRAFHWREFVLVFLGFMTAHMISNLSNDYFGYKRGHDTPDSPRMRYTIHPLSGDLIRPASLVTGILMLAAAGAAIAAFFLLEHGWLAAGFLIAGVTLLFAYDAAPVSLKTIGLGELAVFLVWGPLMVGGGYTMITGRLDPAVFFISIPYGLGVMSILVGKHIDQSEFDQGKKIRTLPVLLGERASRALEIAIVFLMYAVTGTLIALGVITPFSAIAFVAFPRAVRAIKTLLRPRPAEAPPGYVGWPLWYHRKALVHNRLFGWLFILGLMLGALWPTLRF